jgi:transitional endoplasmic reticulum ATPase
MGNVTPSALRSLQIEIPNVKWDDIGGYDDIKQKLNESVTYIFSKKDLVKKMGIQLPRGILLYGPPGSGKTMLAKAIANESQCNFISVKGPEFLSKWVGETERMIREVFSLARRTAPTIIFFDEFDSIAPIRGSGIGDGLSEVQENVVAQILSELDGVEEREDVIFIASTNRPDKIDPAILRKGRIDRLILVPAPDEKARKKIFQVHLKGKNLEPGLDIDALSDVIASKTVNYSGADIASIITEAGIVGLNENRDYISGSDIANALEESRPGLNDKVIQFYEKMGEFFKAKQVEKKYTNDTYT